MMVHNPIMMVHNPTLYTTGRSSACSDNWVFEEFQEFGYLKSFKDGVYTGAYAGFLKGGFG